VLVKEGGVRRPGVMLVLSLTRRRAQTPHGAVRPRCRRRDGPSPPEDSEGGGERGAAVAVRRRSYDTVINS
jgi:hypothetical protein